ncbi:MAG: GspB domain-containing protein [Desulfobulbaceae bacterium]|nr:GspB domain-containing protein [Desulfobulbaceae bacterium]
MSYILDALKKSEQERKKGTVPGLGTIQSLPGRGSDTTWPRRYLPAILLLLLALAGLAWLFLWETPKKPAKITTPSRSPAASAPVTTLAPQAARPSAAPESAARSATPAAVRPEKSSSREVSDRRPTKPATPPATASRLRPLAPTAGTTPKLPQAGELPAPPRQLPTKAALPTKTPAPEAVLPSGPEKTSPSQEMGNEENGPPSSDAPSEAAEVVIKPEDLPIVPLAELPYELKSEMPEVKIGMHFFSDDPISRRAAVNGRLLHEGQQVDKELILKEITRDGAIISFRGRRFSLAVFPR